MRTSRLLVSAVLVFLGSYAPQVRAQVQITGQWKPDVGDHFVCEVWHSSMCGDFGCSGKDTLEFSIADTSYAGDTKHPAAIFAHTNMLASHLNYFSWGQGGYDTQEVAHTYYDTTLISAAGSHLQVLFGGYNWGARGWSDITLEQESSVFFQGVSYPAWRGGNSYFGSTLGWFISLTGYQWPGVCASQCVEEQWGLNLIYVVKATRSVARSDQPETSVTSRDGVLVLSNLHHTSIDLTDLLGRSVRSWHVVPQGPKSNLTLNVSDLSSGIYFVQLHGDGADEIKKVAIER